MAPDRVSLFLLLLIFAFFPQSDGSDYYNYHYMVDVCGPGVLTTYVVDLSDSSLSNYGFVRVVHEGGYPGNMDCRVRVIAPPGYYLVARFRRMDIYYRSSCGPSDSYSDYMYIDNYNETEIFCGSATPSLSRTSLNDTLTFGFFSYDRTTSHNRIGFDLYYTAFHRGECHEENEFQCSVEDRCIPEEVKCDSWDNCGDWSDERTSVCGLSTGAIVTITIICVLVVVCVGFLVFYYYEKKKKAKHQDDVAPTTTVVYSTPTTAAASTPAPSQYVEPPPAYTYMPDSTSGYNNNVPNYGSASPYAVPYATNPGPEGGQAGGVAPQAYGNTGYGTSPATDQATAANSSQATTAAGGVENPGYSVP